MTVPPPKKKKKKKESRDGVGCEDPLPHPRCFVSVLFDMVS